MGTKELAVVCHSSSSAVLESKTKWDKFTKNKVLKEKEI
jgi:hypothetical protein